jgi:hypothetical protein
MLWCGFSQAYAEKIDSVKKKEKTKNNRLLIPFYDLSIPYADSCNYKWFKIGREEWS